MRYATAIFDLDGTLLDTLADLHASVNHALRAFGLPERSVDEVRRFTGNGIAKLIGRSVPEGTPEELTARVFAEFTSFYNAHDYDRTLPYPGIPQAVARLEAAGVAMGLASNKGDVAVQNLMARFFPGMACTGEVPGVPRKPAPEPVDNVLARLGRTREGMVYVGDSEVDIALAANLGCDVIICSWGFRERDALLALGPTWMVDTADELANVILGTDIVEEP